MTLYVCDLCDKPRSGRSVCAVSIVHPSKPKSKREDRIATSRVRVAQKAYAATSPTTTYSPPA